MAENTKGTVMAEQEINTAGEQEKAGAHGKSAKKTSKSRTKAAVQEQKEISAAEQEQKEDAAAAQEHKEDAAAAQEPEETKRPVRTAVLAHANPSVEFYRISDDLPIHLL